MSSKRNFEKYMTLFYFLSRANKLEVDTQGPRRDRCVSDSVLHWTMLIKEFSVLLHISYDCIFVAHRPMAFLLNKCTM